MINKLTNTTIFQKGTRVGTFTILDSGPKRYLVTSSQTGRTRIWHSRKCLCDCGQIRYITDSNLRNRPDLKCRYCFEESRILDVTIEEIANVVSYRAVNRTEKVEWNLSLEQTIRLITSNCFYCNCPPSNKFTKKKGRERTLLFSGIDRVDSNEGYTELNCVSCCKTCNFMKQRLPVDIFLNKIKSIYENMNLQENKIQLEVVAGGL